MGEKQSKNISNTSSKKNIEKKNIKKNAKILPISKLGMLIKCIYEIKNSNEIQIINDRDESLINEEIKKKIKILDIKRNQKENLMFKRKFVHTGMRTLIFTCEEKLHRLDYIFNQCSSLKEIEFISFDTSQVTSMSRIFQKCFNLEKIDLSCFDTSNVTDMELMFNDCHKIKEIKGLTNFNTSKVTNMKGMFLSCFELAYLDLSGFDIKNVKNFNCMFYKCYKLNKIKGIQNFDIKYLSRNFVDTNEMFDECNKFEGYSEIVSVLKNKNSQIREELLEDRDNAVYQNLNNNDNDDGIIINNDNKKERNQILMKCTYEVKDNEEIRIINDRNSESINEEIEKKIKILNGNKKEKLIFKKKFNKIGRNTITFICEEKLKNISFLFLNCSSLKEIEFISFDTSEVTLMIETFSQCKELEFLDLSSFNTSNVTDMQYMFNECQKINKIIGIDDFDTSKVTNMKNMFYHCCNLELLLISNFKTSNVKDMGNMFGQCYKLAVIDLSNINIKNCRVFERMFYRCYNLEGIIGIKNFEIDYLKNELINTDGMFEECNEFEDCIKIKSLIKNKKPFIDSAKNSIGENINFFDLSQVKDDDSDIDENYEMLIKCTYDIKDNNEIQIINNKDKNGDVENKEIKKKLKIMNGNKKEDLILKKKFDNKGLNTVIFKCEKKLKNMSCMFYMCSSLKRIEFISFDTSQVTKMIELFSQCIELEYIDLSCFNTSKVDDMQLMFSECYKLKEIKGINNLDISNTNNIRFMFSQCRELEYLDLSNFDTSNVYDLEGLFQHCLKLKEIKGINNFNSPYI